MSDFSEVAHHPTSLWVSIGRDTHARDLIDETNRFALCILDVSSANIARRVAASIDDGCGGLDLYDGPEGYLFCRQAWSCTACAVTRKIEIDEHMLYIADILAGDFETTRSVHRHLLARDLG